VVVQPNHVSTSAKIERDLEDARRRLVETAKEIGDLIARGGNEKRLTVLRRERDEARNAVDELEAGLAVAIQIEAKAEADRQHAQLEKDFAAFKATADNWTQTGVELAGTLERAAKLRVELGKLSDQLRREFHTGIVATKVDFRMVDTNINSVSVKPTEGVVVTPVEIDVLLAAEMYRSGQPNAFLPGARPPIISLTHKPTGIEPAAVAFKRAGAYFVSLFQGGLNAMARDKEAA
jgi:hypothetical protein